MLMMAAQRQKQNAARPLLGRWQASEAVGRVCVLMLCCGLWLWLWVKGVGCGVGVWWVWIPGAVVVIASRPFG